MNNATSIKTARKAYVDTKGCVACGCCVKSCPRQAIDIFKGMFAIIDKDRCVGCGKCGNICPAGVITIEEAAR